jgi:hypothetical protein
MIRNGSEGNATYSRDVCPLVDLGDPLLDKTKREVDRKVGVEGYMEKLGGLISHMWWMSREGDCHSLRGFTMFIKMRVRNGVGTLRMALRTV